MKMKIELEAIEDFPLYRPAEGGELIVEGTEEQLKEWTRVIQEFERVQDEMYQAADTASHTLEASALEG